MPTPIFQPYSPNKNDDINKQIKGLTNAYYDSTQYLQWILSHLNSSNITSLTTDKLIAGKALIGTALIEELTVGGNVAQGTAARTFVNTPAPPYKVGDLWVEGATGDIKKCKTDRTTGDYSADDWEIAAKYTDDSGLTSFVSGVYASDIESLQSQIDGKVISWFYAYEPTLLNEPALSWNTPELKNNHLGDLFYDTTTGYGYRFSLIESVYQWVRIIDTDVVLALANAQQAQDTADGKRRVFVATPTVPYDVGDLWSGGAAGDLKRCKTAKTSAQSYSADDWELASKYTDDTVANTAIGRLNDISSDSKITPIEKLQAKQEWDIIVKEGNATTGTIIATADAFEVSHDDYSAKYSALEAYLSSGKNLLTANQSNIETDTTGFSPFAIAISRDTTEHWEGSASLKTEWTTSDYCQLNLDSVTIMGGKTYTFSFYVKGIENHLFCYVGDNKNTLASLSFMPNSTWTRYEVSITTKIDATFVGYRFAGQRQTTAYFDGFQFEEGSSATDWIIGGGIFSDMTATDTIDRAEWDTVWEEYFDERTKLMNAISAKAKAIADGSVQLDTLYNKVKISTTDGIQVLDESEVERIKIGNYATGKYGILVKAADGTTTMLSQDGIMQSWGDSIADSVDATHKIRMDFTVPEEMVSIKTFKLSFRLLPFRAYSTGAASGGGATTSDGGLTSTASGGGFGETSAGGGTSGQLSHTSVDSGHNHQYYIPVDHTHYVSGDPHSHGIATHSHTVSSHTHTISYGIHESTSATGVKVYIDGTLRLDNGGSGYATSQSNLDLSQWITTAGEHYIELSSTQLGRISVSYFTQMFLSV